MVINRQQGDMQVWSSPCRREIAPVGFESTGGNWTHKRSMIRTYFSNRTSVLIHSVKSAPFPRYMGSNAIAMSKSQPKIAKNRLYTSPWPAPICMEFCCSHKRPPPLFNSHACRIIVVEMTVFTPIIRRLRRLLKNLRWTSSLPQMGAVDTAKCRSNAQVRNCSSFVDRFNCLDHVIRPGRL